MRDAIRTLTSVLILACTFPTTRPCRSEAATITDSAATTGIHAAYDGINTAFVARDFDRFMTYFTRDFMDTEQDGKPVSRAQTLRNFQEQRKQIISMHSRYDFTTLSRNTDGVLVDMTLHTDGRGQKRILFAKLTGTFTSNLHVHDLWVDTSEGWKLKRRQTLQSETHVHAL